MMQIVVLLKLVPDIRHIPDDAWDLEKGTLRRNRLSLIPNPLDDRALALALRFRDAWGGRVTAVSMGPPRAAELCARARAFGADDAWLITDRACAGSDTIATARVLARAADRARAAGDLLVISGMQSPDGDTAQVPVQVAALLGATVVPYVTQAEFDGDTSSVRLTSLAAVGSAAVALERGHLPAVLTCTERLPTIPFHTSLTALGSADAGQVHTVSAADLGFAPDEVGLAGSATRVVSISVAQSVRPNAAYLEWPDGGDHAARAADVVQLLTRALSDTVPVGPSDEPAAETAAVKTAAVKTAATTSPGVAGGVWAVIDPNAEAGRLGVLAHARRIAQALGCGAVACRPVAGDAAGAVAGDLARAGATDLLSLITDRPDDPVDLAWALSAAVSEFAPQVLLFEASPNGRVTAPYLAALLGAGLTADCTAFSVAPFARRHAGVRQTFAAALYQRRPALGGNIEATIVSPANIELRLPQMATVRSTPTVEHEAAGVVELRWIAPVDHADGRSVPLAVQAAADAARAADDAGAPGVEIERCSVLVSVGRGVGGTAGIDELARPLADALRARFDVDVEVSASRMVVDAGELSRERQVGQTGTVVAPDIYLALGISGAVQHRAGMDGSATIVSINADQEAPIRSISDLFVHGRVQDVVPSLIEALRQPR